MSTSAASLAAHDVFTQFLEERRQAGIPTNEERLWQVFQFARDEYADAMHWTGLRLIDHCLGVLKVFAHFEPDDDAVIACILHHIPDAKHYGLDELDARYGAAVRAIISGEYLLSHVTMHNSRMTLEQMRLMFLKVSSDLRLVLMFLGHQSFILDSIAALPLVKQRRLCRDALHIYAPVAARLGIYSLKHEIERKAFPVVYPTDAAAINEQLQSLHRKHGEFLPKVADGLVDALKAAGIPAQVQVREKQPYSIFHKMQLKTISHVEDLYDLFALRVIVHDQDTCYQTLGVLHRIGHPVAGRFKDYIAFPKPNGYKSLHTTLAQLEGVPEGVFVEVQIRTEAMQRASEYGVAAHWNYKEGGGMAAQAMRRIHLQRALVSGKVDGADAGITDQIFVLTPQGDVIELPEGASPLDFAFHVHSALGLSFRAAKVNGAIVPLDHVLENGDIVDILKFRDPHPSPHWIAHLKSASARSRLKRYLVTHERPAYLAMGKDAMNEELKRRRLPPLDTDLSVLRLFDGVTLKMPDREDLLVKIGQGSQNASSMLPHLDVLKGKIELPVQDRPLRRVGQELVAKVDGNIPMPVLFAKCCKPESAVGAVIAGVIGRSGEVRVHLAACRMLKNVNPERRIGVSWVAKKKR